ncbi:MAG: M23 family metallopeptidase [Deltaproteobacteria bacterium]
MRVLRRSPAAITTSETNAPTRSRARRRVGRGRLLSPFKASDRGRRHRVGRRSIAARAAVSGLAFGVLAPLGAGVAAADTGAHPTCTADAAALTPPGNTFVVGGDHYNIGYDAHWNVFDQAADPSHESDYSGSRPSDARHTSGHHGIDIFGPEGAPLVAPVDSVVIDFGSGGKGGNWVWLQDAETGAAFYYAHLEFHAPDLAVGATIPAGTHVGGLGDTGNAAGTAPHLHFEIHPGGRGAPATNPFDQLMGWRNAEMMREAYGQIEADTFESICHIGTASLEEHPAFLDEDGDRRFFLTASDVVEIGSELGLPAHALDRIAGAIDVLGYANGSRNPRANTVSVIDLRTIAESIDGGESFDATVTAARGERDRLETRRAIQMLASAMEDREIEHDGEALSLLTAEDIRRVAPDYDIPEDIAEGIVAHLDVLGYANGFRNHEVASVSAYDLNAIATDLYDGQSLDAIAVALVDVKAESEARLAEARDAMIGIPIA